MKQALAIYVLVLLSSMAAVAQTPAQRSTTQAVPQTDAERAAKRADIRKLIELTGAANISADALQKMIEPLKASYPQVPEEFWDTFVHEVHSDELVDLVIPIYDKYYTHEEIQELTHFYQTPVGQKTIKVLPKLSAEAIDAGQEWGRTVADRAMRKLREKGYDKTSSATAEHIPTGQ
ncbi:MAG TPA: DUF2059 domain-containing protein [Terriglobales bacterium]|nr:DUF2059 domain-containing protein [Terriglobales bacterium]